MPRRDPQLPRGTPEKEDQLIREATPAEQAAMQAAAAMAYDTGSLSEYDFDALAEGAAGVGPLDSDIVGPF